MTTQTSAGNMADESWNHVVIYTLFHENISTFFGNKISLPERRNKRKSVLEMSYTIYKF